MSNKLSKSLKTSIKKLNQAKQRKGSTVKTKISYSNGLGRIGDGAYQYRFMFNGTVKKGSTQCFDFDSAKKWLLKYKSELGLNNIDLKAATSKKKISEVLTEWVKYNTGKKSKLYIKHLQQRVKDHLIPIISDKPIRQITNADMKLVVSAYLNSKRPGRWGHIKRTVSGCNNLLCHLSALLTFAKEQQYLVTEIKLPFQTEQEKEKKYIHKDKLPEFLKAIDAENELSFSILIRFMLVAGLRISEARSIKWSQINMASLTFVKDRQKNQKVSTKQLPACLVPFLKKAQAAKVQSFFVCPSSHSKEGFKSRNYVVCLLNKVSLSVLGYKLSTHSLRRSFITNLSQSNVDFSTLMALADHSNPKTTLRYIVKEAEQQRLAVEIMEKLAEA